MHRIEKATEILKEMEESERAWEIIKDISSLVDEQNKKGNSNIVRQIINGNTTAATVFSSFMAYAITHSPNLNNLMDLMDLIHNGGYFKHIGL